MKKRNQVNVTDVPYFVNRSFGFYKRLSLFVVQLLRTSRGAVFLPAQASKYSIL